ncbi:gamma-glutamyltransferase [Paraferrimonas sp. SM1919]|uniref:gamma-glutamyltransferase n=1 Tax=Paraferrimonas sp. SM1919 TaxID=2662263 RepID=UPI001F09E367|nr:gamma-glutamyltransferase [Paraferrimonas sp. SM1919]
MIQYKLFTILAAASLCAPCIAKTEVREPEATVSIAQSKLVSADKWMAATANPHATEAAAKQLKNGGSVIDAALAAQLTLTLTEPQSSGIGGGFFMLYWDQQQQQLFTVDARETAPASATPDLFKKPDGSYANWFEAIVGGRSVGVPGVIAGFELAHQKWGKLPWQSSFSHARNLAENGFKVSPRLHGLLARRLHPGFKFESKATDYFYPGGEPLAAGTLIKNPELAATYKLIAKEGAKGFYQGQLAQKMVAATNHSHGSKGNISLGDFKGYSALVREPVCSGFLVYSVCGMGPPSSGGISVGQILATYEQHADKVPSLETAEGIHLYSQAARLAFADRELYIADSDFVAVDSTSLLSPDYINQRASQVDMNKDMGKAKAGKLALAYAEDQALELPSTTHLVMKDSHGNWLSMTSSIEMAFGSSVMVGGFLLNNQLTDFSLVPSKDGLMVANRVEANKRPRSSMAPTMVLKDNQPVLAIGSPGGSRIINYVSQALINKLMYQQPLDKVLATGRVTHRNDYLALEKGSNLESLVPALEAKGHNIKVIDLNSGIQAIEVKNGKLYGAADPRREGVVIGQ